MYLKNHFLYLLMRCILLVFAQRQASESLDFCFNSTLEGCRLNTKVLMTKVVSEKIDCIMGCVTEPCCRSINYKKTLTLQNEPNCEMLHNVVYNTTEKLLEINSSYDYAYLINPQKDYNTSCCPNLFEDNIKGTSCLDIKNRGLSYGDGKYMIDPDGDGQGIPFEVYCDMTSFGGGWTMCYTTDSNVSTKTELTTTPDLGYRADCNNIPFTGVMFVDKKSKQKAVFTKNGSPVTFFGNYDKNADRYGLWTAQGVATTGYKYQMLICDTTFYKGLHFSGYPNGCFKQCNRWCGDKSSAYFRTSAFSDRNFNGVAFNENGHRPRPNRLISAGIR